MRTVAGGGGSRPGIGAGLSRRAHLLLVGEPVPHVRQRLLVHRLVLEHRAEREAPPQHRVVVARDVLAPDRLLDQARPQPRRSGGSPRASGQPSEVAAGDAGRVLRVDPALEEDLEVRVDPFAAEAALDQRVDAEGGQVAFVEADRIAQRDRPLVVGLRPHGLRRSPPSGAGCAETSRGSLRGRQPWPGWSC